MGVGHQIQHNARGPCKAVGVHLQVAIICKMPGNAAGEETYSVVDQITQKCSPHCSPLQHHYPHCPLAEASHAVILRTMKVRWCSPPNLMWEV